MSSSTRSDHLPSGLRQCLEGYVAAGKISGAAALIGHGADCHAVAVGTKAFGAVDPIERDSIFRIASMTKPMTAAAALMLIEDGKLSLNEPVDRLLPELSHRRVLRRLDGPLDDTVPAKRPITVEDLLSFRLGTGLVLAPPDTYPIQRAIADLELMGFGPPDPASPLAPDEWLRRLGTLPLMAQPGERWLYTAGSNVLGVLIARASGCSLPEFLADRLFAPLGMKDTRFHVPADSLKRLVCAYRPSADGLALYDAPPESAWGVPPAFPAGDAGLVSTVDDMFAFSRLLLQRGCFGDRRLMSEESVDAMMTDRLTAQQRTDGDVILGPDRGWGCGLSVTLATTAESIPAGACGWNGGLGTSWMIDPRSDVTAILMTQTMFTTPDPPAIHKDFWRFVFAPAEA